MSETTHVDSELYDRLKEPFEMDALTYIQVDAKLFLAQRQDFYDGNLRNPVFTYSGLTKEVLAKMNQFEMLLLEARKELRGTDRSYARIMQGGWNSITRSLETGRRFAYLWRINEALAKVRLIKACASGKTKRAQRYSIFMFGKPDYKMYRASVAEVRAEVRRWQEAQPENEDLKRVGNELLTLLPDIGPEEQYELPKPNLIAKLTQYVREQFKSVIEFYENRYGADKTQRGLENLGDLPFVTKEEAIVGFQFAMQVFALFKFGFNLIVTWAKRGYSVSQKELAIYIPADPDCGKIKCNELVRWTLHEVCVHPLRRLRGQLSKLRLMEFGLDRYEAGEEGSAIAIEDAYTGEVLGYGFATGPVGVSLALGLDGTPRDFRGLFEIMSLYAICRRLGPQKLPLEKATHDGKVLAFDNTMRTFRSGDPSIPGRVFTRDIIYRRSNRAFWETMESHPERLEHLLDGKYDLANERHMWILECIEAA